MSDWSRQYTSAVSMKLTPARSDAWITLIASDREGRPAIESGIPPKPIWDT